MKHVRYVGDNPNLLGQTALVISTNRAAGTLEVQVDDKRHPWAFGKHVTFAEDWKVIEDEPNQEVERST